jgi:hypothetical protein
MQGNPKLNQFIERLKNFKYEHLKHYYQSFVVASEPVKSQTPDIHSYQTKVGGG